MSFVNLDTLLAIANDDEHDTILKLIEKLNIKVDEVKPVAWIGKGLIPITTAMLEKMKIEEAGVARLYDTPLYKR